MLNIFVWLGITVIVYVEKRREKSHIIYLKYL